jgi:hypothetical protein
MRTTVLRLAFVLLAAAVPVVAGPAGGDEQTPPGVNQKAINDAIVKGAQWLLKEAADGKLPDYDDKSDWKTTEELALYALLHAGADPKQPEVVKLLQTVLAREPEKTYTAAIRAQALQKYDVKLLADHVRQAAQYLVDTQSQQGYWGYGNKVDLPKAPPVTVTPDTSKTYTGPKGGPTDIFAGGAGRNTTATARTVLKRGGWGQHHDNSNTQYALLGLGACMAGGFYPPQDCLDLAEKWLTDCQDDDGGYNYKERGSASYGSMTAGGVSSLAIVLRAKGNLMPRKDIRVVKALKWLGANLNFGSNPQKGGWHYYWIYSVERAGSAAGTEWFGDRPWFKEGADYLLGQQNDDGSWGKEGGGKKICNTAWAILFLRRATRSIVYSGTGK